ncbi:Ribosomal RNA-processing protein 14 [Smittium culicis]|uniref:Ribosomal RNA-processing protein 14 n=1 Tax=Smittium culicis TaxID=133412 RepID=A0A1R1X3R5_9FUNG|nr:Ribosomal RNA-processing protein 14 [Smittium culicis]OMJ15070.1 Ribosomal RNA-processing protein 14 [Smittium culicis]
MKNPKKSDLEEAAARKNIKKSQLELGRHKTVQEIVLEKADLKTQENQDEEEEHDDLEGEELSFDQDSDYEDISETEENGENKIDITMDEATKTPASMQAVGISELRDRLQNRIEMLRKNRMPKKPNPNAQQSQPRNNSKKRQRALPIPHVPDEKLVSYDNISGSNSHQDSINGSGDFRKAKKLKTDISIGNNLDISSPGGKASSKGKKKAPPTKHQKLLKIKSKKEKLETLAKENPEKHAEIAENSKWTMAILKASGVKLSNDEKLVAKSLKKQQQAKNKSAKTWAERKSTVKKSIAERQSKREANLKARSEGKKKSSKKGSGGKSSASKGVKVSKSSKKSGSSAGKKTRPGFEGAPISRSKKSRK